MIKPECVFVQVGLEVFLGDSVALEAEPPWRSSRSPRRGVLGQRLAIVDHPALSVVYDIVDHEAADLPTALQQPEDNNLVGHSLLSIALSPALQRDSSASICSI